MKEYNTALEFKINELKKSMEHHSKDLENNVNEYDQKINDVVNGEAAQHVVAQAKEMKAKLIDLEDRTRRNNLSGLMHFWRVGKNNGMKKRKKEKILCNTGLKIIQQSRGLIELKK